MNLPKRIILSRKGFDTITGGMPSPILADGRLASIPIPEFVNGIPREGQTTNVATRYADLRGEATKLAGYLEERTRRRKVPITRSTIVHLDPDLRSEFRTENFGVPTLLFGQSGSAAGHLRNQCVGPGDLFLFYGLFKRIGAGRYPEFDDSTTTIEQIPDGNLHLIWGWLEIETRCSIPRQPLPVPEEIAWASHHPHIQERAQPNNYIFTSSRNLTFRPDTPGGGVFPRFDPGLVLTVPDGNGCAAWREEEFPFLATRTRQRQEHVIESEGRELEIQDWLNLIFEARDTEEPNR